MVVRILIGLFTSFIGGYCCLAGLQRLMAALLLAFGSLGSLLFAILFSVPSGSAILGYPVYGKGAPIPFYVLSFLLMAGALFLAKGRVARVSTEPLSKRHWLFLGWGLVAAVNSVFIPAFLWFPSKNKLLADDANVLAVEVSVGVFVFCCLYVISLYCFYRAVKGVGMMQGDFMRRLVLAVFTVFQLDKIPMLIGYLLIYSPETQIVFAHQAAVALLSYLFTFAFFWSTTGELKYPQK